jgi:hypothetical protein
MLAGLFTTGCITDPNIEINEKALNDKDFLTEIKWTAKEKDLGTIEEGQKVEIVYEYTNVGQKPLVIKNVAASCGCTVPELPKVPVMPGKTGVIKAVFDSRGKPGINHKSITVNANTKPEESFSLEFTVNVNPAPVKPS